MGVAREADHGRRDGRDRELDDDATAGDGIPRLGGELAREAPVAVRAHEPEGDARLVDGDERPVPSVEAVGAPVLAGVALVRVQPVERAVEGESGAGDAVGVAPDNGAMERGRLRGIPLDAGMAEDDARVAAAQAARSPGIRRACTAARRSNTRRRGLPCATRVYAVTGRPSGRAPNRAERVMRPSCTTGCRRQRAAGEVEVASTAHRER